ncbi:MAG: YdiU family protein [Pseudomonadota bacterium]
MTLDIPFDNSYARLPDAFFTSVTPEPASDPSLVGFNNQLAYELGISITDTAAIAAQLSGQTLPKGAAPLAQVYAGHQFGSYNPQLGDGRAVLLGELIDTNGIRRDIQLKGSGRTPYSRMGDGKAWLGPVLREYVISEAMHALGVPTTRALAAVRTGERVVRETVLPGAVLTRVAQSHLRVGTFEYFARTGQIDALKLLTEYAINRHYPQAGGAISLLQNVVAAQAQLIPAWMSFGFIHGVMNTDNCTISGETIDYGPCAFMDVYEPMKVFSSIDQMGRYAFGNQPRIVVWNMAQLATALIQQCDDKDAAVQEATRIVHAMPAALQRAWLARFGRKIGLADAQLEDEPLIQDLFDLMAAQQADFTNTFRTLGTRKAREQFLDPQAFDAWDIRWSARVKSETDVDERLASANPQRIPRNHQVEYMINAALGGDNAPFDRLLASSATPFETQSAYRDLENAPTTAEIVPATFCGT